MNWFGRSSEKKDNDEIDASVSRTALSIWQRRLEEEFFFFSALKPFRV